MGNAAECYDGHIEGGYFCVAHRIIETFYDKPPQFLNAWIWLLGKAYYADWGTLRRGQIRSSHAEIKEWMGWRAGNRREAPTDRQVRTIFDWMVSEGMIAITRPGSHGDGQRLKGLPLTGDVIITVLKYDQYQDQTRYQKRANLRPGSQPGVTPYTARESLVAKASKKNLPPTPSDNPQPTQLPKEGEVFFSDLQEEEQSVYHAIKAAYFKAKPNGIFGYTSTHHLLAIRGMVLEGRTLTRIQTALDHLPSNPFWGAKNRLWIYNPEKLRQHFDAIEEQAIAAAPPKNSHAMQAAEKQFAVIIDGRTMFDRYTTPICKNPITAKVIAEIGWATVCDTTDQVKLRQRFIDAYTRHAELEKDC